MTWLPWAGTAVLPPGSGSTVSTLRGMTVLHCVSRKEKPGQPGEDVRAVKQWVNGISISRWSLDNGVAHLGGRWRELGWEEKNWQHVAFDLQKPLTCKAWFRKSGWTYVPFLWDSRNLGCCPGITRHGALFYSQKHPGLHNKSYSHPTYRNLYFIMF